MALRWRRQPNETGLARVAQRERGYELRRGGIIIIHVSPHVVNRFEVDGWYWYGAGVNTYNTRPLFGSADEAKSDAMAHAKERGL